MQAESQARPPLGQARRRRQPLISEANSAKAEDHRLPDATRRRRVDAFVSIAAHILKIGARGVDEVPVRSLHIALPRRQRRLDARPQRGAIREIGARRVVVPVALDRRSIVLSFQQIQQHQHIGLLENLVALRLLDAQQKLQRFGARLVIRQIYRFQSKEALKLLNQPGFCIHRNEHTGDNLAPVRQPRRIQIQGAFQLCCFGRRVRAQPIENFQRGLEIPHRHAVSIGAVVDVVMVFIRADHIVDFVALFVRMPLGARSPEARRIEEDFRAEIAHEGIVAGGAPVLHHGIRHIRGDVQLDVAAPDADQAAFRTGHPSRRGLVAGGSALPGEHRPLVAVLLRLAPRPWQRVIAIVQHIARQFRAHKGEERQHEDFRIPEHVPAIAPAAQRLSRDAHPVIIARRGNQQLEEAVAQRQVGLVVALDANVGGFPLGSPGDGIGSAQHLVSRSDGGFQFVARCCADIRHIPRGVDGNELIRHERLPRHNFSRCNQRRHPVAVLHRQRRSAAGNMQMRRHP